MSKLLLLLSSALAFLAHAASISAQTPYELLTPVGDVSGSVTPEEYIIAIYRAGIWAAAALAVVMIVWGGVQYAGSEVVTSKENAKKQIAAAIGGLVLALGAYLLLQTINPDLVNFSVDVGRVDVAVDAPVMPDSLAGFESGAERDIADNNVVTAEFLSSMENVQIASNASGDCTDASGNKVGPALNFEEMRSGEPLTVCSASCTQGVPCQKTDRTMDKDVMNTVLELGKQDVRFLITSIATGKHSNGSEHYDLNAIDIQPKSGQYLTVAAKLDSMINAGAPISYICENKSGKTSCNDPTANHIHIQGR